jgi:predicted Fe-Mo cluster-binding NifX family protein
VKIAAVSDDGVSISPHFGRASHYAVITVEGRQIVKRELRDKLGHSHFVHSETGQADGQPHGFGPEAEDRHSRMIAAIEDCQVLLARGMGWGARRSLEQAGIQAILTDLADIEAAVKAYLSGDLVDHTELLH